MQKFLVHHSKEVIEHLRGAAPAQGEAHWCVPSTMGGPDWGGDVPQGFRYAGAKAVFLVSADDLGVAALDLCTRGSLPECRCRRGSGSELCRGEQPCTEGTLGNAPLNLCLGWAGMEIWH